MFDDISARSRIKRAYIDYLKLKPYNKIKVSDITATAGINRSTFYRNYDDIYSLYTSICDELISVILYEIRLVNSSEDIKAAAFASVEKAMEHRELLTLLAGEHGNIQFLFKLRNEYFGAMKESACAAGLWNEERHSIVSFSADYLVLYLNREINNEKFVFESYSDVNYTYSYDIDPIENMSNALKILNGGNTDIQSAFFLSVIRRFSTGDYRRQSITELFSFTGFSRTEFYKIYSNRTDYFSKLENALCLIVSKTIIPLLLGNDPDCLNRVLDNWDTYHSEIERSAVINGIKGGYVLDMGIRVLNYIYNGYLEEEKKLIGEKMTPDCESALGFFVCSAICCFVYYIANENREQYFSRMHSLFAFKDKMLRESIKKDS